MALTELSRETSSLGLKRIYYTDDEGRLVERLMTMSEDVDPVMEQNQQEAAEFRPHQKGAFRKIASVPAEVWLSWMMEEGQDGYLDDEAREMVLSKKLADPQNKYFLTVPSTYRMMKHG